MVPIDYITLIKPTLKLWSSIIHHLGLGAGGKFGPAVGPAGGPRADFTGSILTTWRVRQPKAKSQDFATYTGPPP